MMGPLTYLDAALIAVPLIFGFLAAWRGLTRSVVSLPVRIVLALLVTSAFVILFLGGLAAQVAKLISTPAQTSHYYIARVVIGLAFFVIVLVILSRIRSRITRQVGDRRAGPFDRSLAFLFGAGASFGLLLLGITLQYMRYEILIHDPNQRPIWVRTAVMLPLIKRVSESIRPLLQESLPPPSR